MKLKRLYHQDKLVRDAEGRVTEVKPGAVAGVVVKQADRGVHHFTQHFIDGGIKEGWLALGGGRLTITPVEGPPVVYRIVRTPGHYCCHCDQPIPDAAHRKGSKTVGLLHVEKEHAGKPSPDPSNPAGYRHETYYTCVNEGRAVDTMTREEAESLERGVREAVAARTGNKLLSAKERALAKIEQLRAKAKEKKEALDAARAVTPPLSVMGFVLSLVTPFLGILCADLVFNVAKGAVSLYYQNVDGNNPANSALIILILDANGETDDNMRDADTVTALLALLANEATNTNYARKTLTDADLSAFAPDDTNNRVDLDIPDQTWTAVAAGDAWTDFVVAYDGDTTAGTDANVTPLTLHDFAVTPDGSDITAQIATAGFFRAA